MVTDNPQYLEKRNFYRSLLTIYGRKPVWEALQNDRLRCHRLHLASSNRPAQILTDMLAAAKKRDIEVVYHSRQSLSRISKNIKQDQGVAADIICERYRCYRDYLDQFGDQQPAADQPRPAPLELLALDRITNPQNLGMIIRSVCAGALKGLILPRQGCANIDPLVIKASVGTVFNCNILHCETLEQALIDFKNQGYQVLKLSSHAATSIGDTNTSQKVIYVLGNETDGVSPTVEKLCDQSLSIPMQNGVESLNVAVAAALIAFRRVIQGL